MAKGIDVSDVSKIMSQMSKELYFEQRWARKFFVCLQIANPQILGFIPQSQILKFLRRASPQFANPQISLVSQPTNRKSANPQICKEKNNVSDPDPHWFASNIFFTYVNFMLRNAM
jgi:hypothetical protein